MDGAGSGTRQAKSTSWRYRPWTVGLVLAVLACLVTSGLAPSRPPQIAAVPRSRVIVTAGSVPQATDAVNDVFGVVVSDLPAISAVVALVTPTAERLLSGLTGVSVSADTTGQVLAVTDPGPRAPAAAFPTATGATRLAAAGDDGGGVTVAIVDTGIDRNPDLAGRLIGGVDLTGQADPFKDGHGHGTFVAGLIAGDGASSGGKYAGEAPGASLVSVKVAGASGATDLATVLQGIQWTMSNQHRFHIRVLNLSLGVVPNGPTANNPLDRAVEAAWRAGIVVVSSAGNGGPTNKTILSPGDDPLVITAGALDDNGTAAAADDTMTAFSSVGPTSPDGFAKPDLVASGRSVVSLRAVNSTIDAHNPTARIGAANFVGSGTSFSAAITSGAAALVIDAHPSAAPDEIKARLLASAAPGPAGNAFIDGHGALDVYAAATKSVGTLSQTSISAGAERTSGELSSLSPPTVVGSAWNGSAWNGSAWNGSAWNGSAWD